MKPTVLALLGAALVGLTACTDSTSGGLSGPALPSAPPMVAAPPTPKPSFAQAQRLSDQVKVGMRQSTVEAMFGPPDEAGYRVYGAATETPWQGLMWEWNFTDVTPPRVLSIVFQKTERGEWLVNHGDWP